MSNTATVNAAAAAAQKRPALIVNQALQSSAVSRMLQQAFRVRFADIPADFLIPGSLSTAVALLYEDEILFDYLWAPKLQRIQDVCAKNKQVYVLFVGESDMGVDRMVRHIKDMHVLRIRRYLSRDRDVTEAVFSQLAGVIFLATEQSVPSTLQTFSLAFTKQRDALRQEQVELLYQKKTSKEVAQNVIATIPDLNQNAQDRFILQDCFGSIANLSCTTVDEIVSRTPCSRHSATAVDKFFNRPSI